MITPEVRKALQNTSLCDVHQDTWNDVLNTIVSLEAERDRLKAELEPLKSWMVSGKFTEIQKDRDAWKARAERLAETLHRILSYTDEADGVFGLININHKTAKETLAAYEKDER